MEFLEGLKVLVDNYGVSGTSLIALIIIVNYMMRLRDHIREERRIEDFHFSKVKEHISDSLEGLEEKIFSRGADFLEIINVDRTNNVCVRSQGKDCYDLQVERFGNDLNKGIDQKVKNKSIGWMKENGFHEEDTHGVSSYITTRKKQVMNFFVPYLEKKAENRFKALHRHIGEIVIDSEIQEYLEDIVQFSIDEGIKADESIRKYRASHSIIPQSIINMIPKSKK